MAEKFFPFRSVSGDRKYSAEDWAAYFALLLSNGVCYNSADKLKVVTNEGMKVKVITGSGFINGRMYMLETDKILTLDTADGALNRIDRIVLRCDYTGRKMGVEVKKGSYSENPTAPSLTRDADVYELALADVYVAAGVIEITTANITDQRLNTSLCGIVTGLIDQADTEEIFNQFTAYLEAFKQTSAEDFNEQLDEWDAEFNSWFAEIKAALEGDVATELAARVLALEDGTTPAGDSAKLGGKGASEYALVSGTYLATSILDYALTLPFGEHFIRFSGDSYSGNDLPSSNYKYGTANINKRGSNAIEVILWGSVSADARKIAVNFYNGTSWVGWDTDAKTSDLANYLPLNGVAKMKGPLEFNYNGRNVYFQVTSNGRFVLVDATNGKVVMELSADGTTNTFNGTASGNLPLSGGVITNNASLPLALKNTSGNVICVQFAGKDGNMGSLGFTGHDTPVFIDKTSSIVKELLHAGNYKNYPQQKLEGWTDERGIATVPSDYNGQLKVFGLKEATAIGLSGLANGYSCVMGVNSWTDSSGGGSHEFALNADGEIYTRHALNDDEWGGWKKSLNTGNSAAVKIGTTAPADTSALWVVPKS